MKNKILRWAIKQIVGRINKSAIFTYEQLEDVGIDDIEINGNQIHLIIMK